LLESVLAEEFAHTLNIQSLLANPAAVSKNMIKADMASAQQIKTASSVADVGPGGGTAAAADRIREQAVVRQKGLVRVMAEAPAALKALMAVLARSRGWRTALAV